VKMILKLCFVYRVFPSLSSRQTSDGTFALSDGVLLTMRENAASSSCPAWYLSTKDRIPNERTAPWNLQLIKVLKMTEWSVETCSPSTSGNKYCAVVNFSLIIGLNKIAVFGLRTYQHPNSFFRPPEPSCLLAGS